MASSAPPSSAYPCPRSPPKYPDMTGKHRELVKVQKLEREIGFLEGELKSIESLQPSSRSCKEVDSYLGGNPDPLILVHQKIRKPCRFCKWLCGKSCLNLSWICCSGGCSVSSNNCDSCQSVNKNKRCCSGCCDCFSQSCSCLGTTSCKNCCCSCMFPSKKLCSDCCSCIRCTTCCSCLTCPKTTCCSCLTCSTKISCNPCRLF